MTFVSEIRIEKPAAFVWSILIDVERWPCWATSFTSVKLTSGRCLTLGSIVAIKQPLLAESSWTVCDWAEGKAFAWISRRTGMTATANHEPIDCGDHCIFRQMMTFKGLLGRTAGWLGWRLITDYMEAEAKGLKETAEARPAMGSRQSQKDPT